MARCHIFIDVGNNDGVYLMVLLLCRSSGSIVNRPIIDPIVPKYSILQGRPRQGSHCRTLSLCTNVMWYTREGRPQSDMQDQSWHGGFHENFKFFVQSSLVFVS